MVISSRWNLATGPVYLIVGAFVGTTALTLSWEKYSKSERQPPKDTK